jgi:hypothetical protein
LYNVIIENLNREPEGGFSRSIYISTSNMNPRVRHISAAQKEMLYNNGVQAARKYFGLPAGK